jgi:hypothetical protein
MFAADMVRRAIAGQSDEDEDKTFAELFGRAVQRSTIFGLWTLGMDASDDMEYNTLPINTILGPVAEKTFGLAHGLLNPDASFIKPAAGLLPFNALLEGRFDDK